MAYPKFIRANQQVKVRLAGEASRDIGHGAVGILCDDGTKYIFRQNQCVLPHGITPIFSAEVLIERYGDSFEEVKDAGTPGPAEGATDGGKATLTKLDLRTEASREYEWTDPATGKVVTKRFDNPVAVYLYKGCTTHRVVTSVDGKEVATIVPSIGYFGCTVKTSPKEGQDVVHS